MTHAADTDQMSAPARTAWPQKQGESLSPTVDSARWNGFAFRDDDIIVATYPKSGTTFTQQIVAQLLSGGDPEVYGADQALSPWIDWRATPDARAVAERQTQRRAMKTHLPAEHLVISPRAKYLVVARDPRDVVWSWHNHLWGFTTAFTDQLAQSGPPPFLLLEDVREYYLAFMDGPGQPEPFWTHIQGWWDLRGLPNVLTLHYADLIADLPAGVRRIAEFLSIPIDEARFDDIVAHCRPDHMRKVAADDALLNLVFKEGANTFINKASNGRWRDVLSPEEIELADRIAARELSPDCAAWLMRP
jgi:aryl sulfotransferase